MNNLVLRFRIETTRRTLDEVHAVRTALRQAKKDLDTLDLLFPHDRRSRDISDTVGRRVLTVRQKLANSIERLEQADFMDDEVMQDLNNALQIADDLRTQSEVATKIVERLRQRWVEIDDDDRIGRTLDQKMVKDAKRWSGAIRDIELGLPNVETPEAMIATWTDWRKTLVESRPLFDEYIDLLSGLALRSVGLCHEVCDRADTLLDLLLRRSSSPQGRSVAVPAHMEALRMTPSQIIRLGFPGWTLWELPLAAHELGHVVVNVATVFSDLAQSTGLPVSPEQWNALCADVFATFALGPSYAYAALLVRLDPVPSGQLAGERCFDLVRAQMICDTLRVVGDGFTEIVDVLEDQWKAALEQTAVADLDGPERAKITEATKAVVAVLRKETPNVEYTAQRWNRIALWKPTLLNGVPEVSSDDDVRDVLNAAWSLRLESPDSSHAIAEHAEELWDAMGKPPVSGAMPSRQHAVGEKGPRT